MTDKPEVDRKSGGKVGAKAEATTKTHADLMAAAETAAPQPSPGFAEGGFVWAMACVVAGRTAKRASWIGNKSISVDHPSRNVLENEDMLAADWVLV